MLKLNKIYNMDVVDFLQSIDENSVDFIITSPPYNCGIDYDSWNDNLKWDDYLKWCEKWFVECYRILKDDGRMAINHYINLHEKGGNSRFPLMDFRNIQQKIGIHPHKLIIWEDKTMAKMTAWGSWLSASAPNIQTPYEGILVSYKKQWQKINKGESTISKDEFMKGVSGTWNLQPETRGLTKANFPVSLPKRCIELFTYKDDLIVDPFMGSGTTAIAAIKTGRNFLGGELSKNYCKVANKRLRDCYKEIENSNKFKHFF